jgi:hypothetical protein
MLFVFFVFATTVSAKIRVEGTVFRDANGNGIQDKGEAGIRNIPVSNGIEIVFTDSRGKYRLESSPGVSVFPILPSEYGFSNRPTNVANANFRFVELDSFKFSDSINFGLQPLVPKQSYSFAAVGDIQVKDAEEIGYAAQSVASELATLPSNDFNIMLGDLVNDDPSLFATVRRMLDCFSSPTWTVYGNHDRQVLDSTTTDAAYNRCFGASSYAFNRNNTHFLVLNNMLPKGRYGYESALSEDGLLFVENDLKLVPKDRLIVIALHGPLAFTGNKDRLLSLLAGRKHVLVLSGHIHMVARFFHRNDVAVIPEIGVGASCGMWWTGEKNEMGIPSALMQCGSYPNYFRIHVTENRFAFDYKAIGRDTSCQMEAWANPLPQNSGQLGSPDSVQIIVNVFGGSDSTQVFCGVDSIPMVQMSKAEIISPNVLRLIQLYEKKIYPTTGNTRNPLRKRSSPHVWQVVLPKLSGGIHRMRIEAKDNYGLCAEAVKIFPIAQRD